MTASPPGRGGLGDLVASFARRFRYPQLLAAAAGLLVVDLLIPDPIPFLDEALLALVTVILAQLRDPGGDAEEPPPEKDVTARSRRVRRQ